MKLCVARPYGNFPSIHNSRSKIIQPRSKLLYTLLFSEVNVHYFMRIQGVNIHNRDMFNRYFSIFIFTNCPLLFGLRLNCHVSAIRYGQFDMCLSSSFFLASFLLFLYFFLRNLYFNGIQV
jgi:hypothetical protein